MISLLIDFRNRKISEKVRSVIFQNLDNMMIQPQSNLDWGFN